MVAPSTRNALPRPLADVANSVLSGRSIVTRYTVDDVLAMVGQGILPEDSTMELLSGVVVMKDRADLGGNLMVHGAKHRLSIRRLTLLAGRIETPRRHAQIQLPLICGIDQMPEPDFALLRGVDADYADRLPIAADVFVIIEAADSSWDRDSREKLAIYAAAAIPQYLILNLQDSTIAQYTEPDPAAAVYRNPTQISLQQTVRLMGGPDGVIEIPAAELLG